MRFASAPDPAAALSPRPYPRSSSWTVGNTTANPPIQISTTTFHRCNHEWSTVSIGLDPADVPSSDPYNSTPGDIFNTSKRLWYVKEAIAVNVPLGDSPATDVDKKKFTQLTAIGLDSSKWEPREPATIDDAEVRVCVTVFLGGMVGAEADTAFNSSDSCGQWLSSEC
jgi:hypothetical protein